MNKKNIGINSKSGGENDEISIRISQIRQYFCENINRLFSTKTGIDEATSAKICSGTRGVGANILEKIVKAFPSVDARWLITGEGEMLYQTTNQVKDTAIVDYLDKKLQEKTEECVRLKLELEAIKEYAAKYAEKGEAYSGTTTLMEK
jgi:hypothetical protein